MRIELAFFDGDELLYRGTIRCGPMETTDTFAGSNGHTFTVCYLFEEPACPVTVICERSGEHLYKSALRFGVHTSDDWESIDLGGVHTLAFQCEKQPS